MSSRAYFSSSRGRFPLLPSPVRVTRSTMADLDPMDTNPNPSSKPSKAFVPHKTQGRAMLARANRTHRKTSESGTENESSDDEIAEDEDDETSDDEDEDGDDESDQPATLAPPRGHKKGTIRKAGRLAEYRRMFDSEDPILYEDPHDLFRASPDDGDDEDDCDDDDLYQAVDDISDEDEQNVDALRLNSIEVYPSASFLMEQRASSFPLPDPEHEADFILGQVDGLSAYGFGDDIDTGEGSGDLSAPSEDGDMNVMVGRRVHFGPDIVHMNARGKNTSPWLTRALLPSAVPMEDEHPIYALDTPQDILKAKVSAVADDTYDSDATEVLSRPPTPIRNKSSAPWPASSDAGLAAPVGGTFVKSSEKSRKHSSRRRKGPPRGIFTVDQDRSWAILDSTGKRILQIPAANTNRHAWLDEMSPSTSTPSTSASPMNASLKLHGPVVISSVAPGAKPALRLNMAVPDVMMAGLTAINTFNGSDLGHTIGPPEAFYSNGLQHVGGDYAISPEPDSDAYEEANPIMKKQKCPLSEFLEDFDESESDLEDTSLPLFAPADHNLTGDNDGLLGHLKGVNVTAFRQSTDPMSASRPGTAYSYEFQTSPIAGSSFALPTVPLRTPTTSHKRKVSTTPYQDEKIYGDVTPVERKVIHVSKRRKVAT